MPPDNDQNPSPVSPAAPNEASSSLQPEESSNTSAPTIPFVSGPASEPTLTTNADGFIGVTLDGRYFIEKELGQGGVGVVYLARDRKLLDKPVVVKVLLEKSSRFERIIQKFQQEKEALTRVDHPGIVGILDTGELADGKPYIVMQFIDGVALREILKPEGMDLEHAAEIIRQTCEALAAAHDKGVFHRDLKPENIMLQALSGGQERVKIIDFGIAKVKDSLVAGSTVIPTRSGTYAYMSPEQYRAERVTAASDVYSLGVIAYEMVTGRRPFNPDTVSQLGELHHQGVKVRPKDLRPSLPVAAQEVILKALSLQPRDRYQNACQFGEALDRALTSGPDPVEHDLESRVSTPRYPHQTKLLGIHQKPAAIFVAIVAVLLIGVAIALMVNKFGRPSGVIGSIADNSVAPGVPRSFTYWLTVQRMRNGKPYKDPFESSGLERFENEDWYQISFTSPQSGYLYVFSEGPTTSGDMSFTIVYPTKPTNDGSAMIGANKVVQTDWTQIGGLPGREQLWMVWSASRIKEMEAARDSALKAKGKVTDAGVLTPLRTLLVKHSEPEPKITKDHGNEQTNVLGSGELLVKLVELVHR